MPQRLSGSDRNRPASPARPPALRHLLGQCDEAHVVLRVAAFFHHFFLNLFSIFMIIILNSLSDNSYINILGSVYEDLFYFFK